MPPLENKSRDLPFFYTKVGKVRLSPSQFLLYGYEEQVHGFHSGFKHFAGGEKPGIIVLMDSQKLFTFIKIHCPYALIL